MEHGPLLNFIMKEIPEGTEFWVSGYANPNLRSRPKTNVKPVKVTMTRNSKENPYRTGVYNSDHKFEFSIATTAKGKIIPVSTGIHVFDTEDEAVTWYNDCLEGVVNQYNHRIMKILGNKIEH